MVVRVAPETLKVGDQVVFTSNGEDHRGTLVKTGLDANTVEVRITEGPGAGGLVRMAAGSVRRETAPGARPTTWPGS